MSRSLRSRKADKTAAELLSKAASLPLLAEGRERFVAAYNEGLDRTEEDIENALDFLFASWRDIIDGTAQRNPGKTPARIRCKTRDSLAGGSPSTTRKILFKGSGPPDDSLFGSPLRTLPLAGRSSGVKRKSSSSAVVDLVSNPKARASIDRAPLGAFTVGTDEKPAKRTKREELEQQFAQKGNLSESSSGGGEVITTSSMGQSGEKHQIRPRRQVGREEKQRTEATQVESESVTVNDGGMDGGQRTLAEKPSRKQPPRGKTVVVEVAPIRASKRLKEKQEEDRSRILPVPSAAEPLVQRVGESDDEDVEMEVVDDMEIGIPATAVENHSMDIPLQLGQESAEKSNAVATQNVDQSNTHTSNSDEQNVQTTSKAADKAAPIVQATQGRKVSVPLAAREVRVPTLTKLLAASRIEEESDEFFPPRQAGNGPRSGSPGRTTVDMSGQMGVKITDARESDISVLDSVLDNEATGPAASLRNESTAESERSISLTRDSIASLATQRLSDPDDPAALFARIASQADSDRQSREQQWSQTIFSGPYQKLKQGLEERNKRLASQQTPAPLPRDVASSVQRHSDEVSLESRVISDTFKLDAVRNGAHSVSDPLPPMKGTSTETPACQRTETDQMDDVEAIDISMAVSEGHSAWFDAQEPRPSQDVPDGQHKPSARQLSLVRTALGSLPLENNGILTLLERQDSAQSTYADAPSHISFTNTLSQPIPEAEVTELSICRDPLLSEPAYEEEITEYIDYEGGRTGEDGVYEEESMEIEEGEGRSDGQESIDLQPLRGDHGEEERILDDDETPRPSPRQPEQEESVEHEETEVEETPRKEIPVKPSSRFGGVMDTIRSSLATLSSGSFIPKVNSAGTKSKTEIKSLQAAAAAAKKEQESKERRAQRAVDKNERTKLALQRKQEEEQRRIEEIRKREEEKTRRVEATIQGKKQEEEALRKKNAERMQQAAERRQADEERTRGANKDENNAKIVRSGIPTASKGEPVGAAKPVKKVQPVKASIARSSQAASEELYVQASTTKAANKTILSVSNTTASSDSCHAPIQNPVLGSLYDYGESNENKSAKSSSDTGSVPHRKPENKEKGPTTIVDENGNLPEPPSDYSDSDLESSDSEKTPRPKQKRKDEPDWVQTPELMKLLMAHEKTDPDMVFGGPSAAPPLEDVFREGMKRSKQFRARQSSAWTGADRLTEAEILAYKQEMGYLSRAEERTE
ncbi:uncharacterized protein SPPG_02807 [Spizellomyces punctatus DAOM BR117]|uniref:Inner centromere protein ARK-binding domain-containing protein n=1 Tax=Spizellomyces punctatus (strain DAOM BR117) TaxID=645134 RepID=A0A0L0HN31_SPIPD|nr:uncharacterized protein SPPG_02807 [Spizellomyces punctatus DAOM BR117]KND02335.1 hypothetical protein SPPG_02807 [Spizellomyces punctatus DAOM BR117]|eukprot:XP_016610374.1 hypothetical protein SPPG_02807 [Spizellomyces punctatus DAOM BR117]